MIAKTASVALILLIILSSTAVAQCFYFGYQPREDFGDAYRQAKANQILNPEAARNLDPVEGFEGRAAEKVMQKYVDSFGKTQVPATNILQLGFGQSPDGTTK